MTCNATLASVKARNAAVQAEAEDDDRGELRPGRTGKAALPLLRK